MIGITLKEKVGNHVLAILIAKYEDEGFILTDEKRNKLAWDLLKEFSNGVDRARIKQKKVEGVDEADSIYRMYLLTVSQALWIIIHFWFRQKKLY